MQFYLSSYRFGSAENVAMLRTMVAGRRIAYITNAQDYDRDSLSRKSKHIDLMGQLMALGCQVDTLDLQEYFGRLEQLQQNIEQYNGFWVTGGNVFLLRQAFALSGFDQILLSFWREKRDLFYGGYSAGCCVLSPTLRGLDLVDDSTLNLYGIDMIMRDGLGILDTVFVPHYQSDHPESAAINDSVAYLKEHHIPYATYHDGEVVIIR